MLEGPGPTNSLFPPPIIAYIDNGLPVQTLSRRDFLFPDADEKYVPAVLAHIHDTDVETLNRLLYTQTPEEVVATFPYLSDREKKFACRALFDQWAERLAAGGRKMLPHLMERVARQRLNGHAGDDTPGSFEPRCSFTRWLRGNGPVRVGCGRLGHHPELSAG